MTPRLRYEVKKAAAIKGVMMKDFIGDIVEAHLHPKRSITV